MKVLHNDLGPIQMRNLSHDKYEAIVKMAIEHALKGWNYGKVYKLEDGNGHVTMFRYQKKYYDNH